MNSSTADKRYETDWYADDECIEPRGEPIS